MTQEAKTVSGSPPPYSCLLHTAHIWYANVEATAMAVKQPKRRRSAAQKFKKNFLDQARAESRVNIGEAFERWRDLRELKGMKTDEEVALFLLDR